MGVREVILIVAAVVVIVVGSVEIWRAHVQLIALKQMKKTLDKQKPVG